MTRTCHCSPQLDKLNGIINEADHERMRQKKEYDMVINERDILGTQLVRRNDELALLYEKIKLQQTSLTNGQLAYRDRVNEIRVLKIKVSDLKRELHILKSTVANVDVLKREVHHLGRELLQERTKVKALSEELENPLNVHRCGTAQAYCVDAVLHATGKATAVPMFVWTAATAQQMSCAATGSRCIYAPVC